MSVGGGRDGATVACSHGWGGSGGDFPSKPFTGALFVALLRVPTHPKACRKKDTATRFSGGSGPAFSVSVDQGEEDALHVKNCWLDA